MSINKAGMVFCIQSDGLNYFFVNKGRRFFQGHEIGILNIQEKTAMLTAGQLIGGGIRCTAIALLDKGKKYQFKTIGLWSECPRDQFFRSGMAIQSRPGKYAHWDILDGDMRFVRRVKSLSGDEASYPLDEGLPTALLLERVKSEWIPSRET